MKLKSHKPWNSRKTMLKKKHFQTSLESPAEANHKDGKMLAKTSSQF